MGMLDGKVAILTGSGRGIGAAAAKLFASEGALVVVSDLDPAPAEETAAAIRNAGGQAIVLAGDVTSADFPARLIQATLDTYHGLDIIVNNAGYTWDAVIQNMSDQAWTAMLDVHVTAPFRILREASQYIREAAKKEQAANGRANPRKVVNVTSVSGVYGNAGQANYSTAKAGVTGLTKTLAKEWGRYNVQVNCVCYGFIETRLTAAKEQAANGRANPRKVVNVTSVSGVYGNAGQANYSTAKAGVTGLTKTLAKEWGRYNVQVNCVCYGFIETRLTAAKEQAEKVVRAGQEIQLGVPDQMRQMAPMLIPLGRPGTPEEAAGPMLFLASPLANYVSGIVLEVTGGRAL